MGWDCLVKPALWMLGVLYFVVLMFLVEGVDQFYVKVDTNIPDARNRLSKELRMSACV